MGGEKGTSLAGGLRRVRLWLVLLICALFLAAGSLLTLYADRDLLRTLAVAQLREVVEREAGLEFHLAQSRAQLFPFRIIVEGAAVSRRGEQWVLLADETELSMNLYALLFRRGGVARVKLHRPYFLLPREGERAGSASGVETSPRRGGGFDMASLLAARLPLRSLEIVDGVVEAALGRDDLLDLRGVDLSAHFSGGRLMADMSLRQGRLRRRGRVWDVGPTDIDLTVDKRLVTVRRLRVESPLGEGRISGTVDYTGAASLDGSLSVVIGEVTERLGLGRPLEGTLSFQGSSSGSLRNPVLEGRLALFEPVYGGHPWPGLKGTVRWAERKLAWRDLSVALGGGKLRSSGSLDFSGDVPRHSLAVDAEGVDAGDFPALREKAADFPRRVDGRFRWEGEGLLVEEIRGEGMLAAGFLLDAWKGGGIELEGQVTVADGSLSVPRLEAVSGDVSVRASGWYAIDGAYGALLEGRTGELSTLLEHWDVEDIGGRLFLEGELRGSREGFSYSGPLRLEDGIMYGLRNLEASGMVSFDGRRVSLAGGLVRWKEAEGRIDGTILLPTREMDLLARWEGLGAADLARIFVPGGSEEVGGTISMQGRALGDWREPILAGRFAAQSLSYDEIRIEEAEGSLTLSKGSLSVSEVTLRSGSSSLSFAGRLADMKRITGSFESPEFDLRAFVPGTAADVEGEIWGLLRGTVDDPVLNGHFHARSLTYATLNLKGGEGDFEYRAGLFSLEGSLLEEVNRYRLVVGVGETWPFEASVALERFSPELAREGLIVLPRKVREALEGFAFLAAGSFHAAGDLADPLSITARLELGTVWVYTKRQTLQNRTPLRVLWKDGAIEVESFTLVGEDYLVTAGGTGGPEEGWNMAIEGQVDLALFERYLEEVEAVDAPGDVRLNLVGPWGEPQVEGTVLFRGGSAKLRSLEEPLRDLSGAMKLSEKTLTLSDFSVTMGESAFIAGGLYDFGTGEVDALVEGRLDVSLFKARIPGAREMKGPVVARLSFKGPAIRPEILGEAMLEDVELFHQAVPQRVRNLNGRVILKEKRIELQGLSGKMGEGEVRIEGHADWSGGPVKMDFAFQGRKVVLVLEGTAKALLNADLTLRGELEQMKLAGTVAFLRGRYFREFKDKIEGLPGFGTAGKDEGKKRKAEEILGNLALDVSIKAPDRFWIANSMAKIENSVDIHIGGTVREPLLDGEISLLRGEVTYFSRRFTLYSGRIHNSSPGIDPVVEAQAEVISGDTRIYLLLEGPLRRPTLQLTSLPPMGQEDLIALLTVGHTRSSLEEQKGEALAIGAAVVFGTPVIEQIGEGTREITGIEMFQVEPAIGEEGGGAKVTLGTRLSDRLYMSASQSIGLTDDRQLRLEYQIFDYLSLLGQQLQQGIYSLDVVLQFDFD